MNHSVKSLLIAASIAASCQLVQAQQPVKISVDSMFSLLERNNAALVAARSQVDVADHGIDVAKSARLPDIDVEASLSFIGNALITNRDFTNVHGLSSPHLGNSLTVQVSQPLYAGGAIDAGIKSAQVGRDLAAAGVTLTREQLRYKVLSQYLELYRIDNRIRVVNSNIDLARKLIDQITDKHRQGVALSNDVTRYQVQLESLRLKLTTLTNDRSVVSHQLCSDLGLPQGTSIVPDEAVACAAMPQVAEAEWQHMAATQSPQLMISRLNEQLSDQQLRQARSLTLPQVALVAANNFNGPITFELPPIDKNLNVWYVGVGVKYSLSSLYKGRRRVRQAQVERRLASERTTQTATALTDAVQQACVAYSQAQSELATQQRQVQLARQNYEVVSRRYANQLVLVTDMIDAANTMLNAELLEADARAGIVQAYWRVRYLAGNI